jgi:hypothetical protein
MQSAELVDSVADVATKCDAVIDVIDANRLEEHVVGRTSSKHSTKSTRSEVAAQCSVDYDVLRAAPARKILWNFANVMRSNTGGDATYNLSRPAEIISQFWSHSWQANAAVKICTLLLFYNGTAAAVASVVASGTAAALMQYGLLSGNACMGVGCGSHSECPTGAYCDIQSRCFSINKCLREENSIDGLCPARASNSSAGAYDGPAESFQFFGWPFVFGATAYLITVILWQARTLVFLDKVCIHQSDPHKKRKGIDGLGGFLSCSSQMVIFWDHTYFDRLWCTFELAAYTHLKGAAASIPVVPVMRGVATFTILGGSTLFYASQITPLVQTRPLMLIAFNSIIVLFLSLFGTYIGRHYARDRSNLHNQLQNFKISGANCTCCTWGHINPFTNEKMECDRPIVEDAVRDWFVGGLDEFDQHVREGMYRKVVGKMPCIMGYRELILASLPAVWYELCKLGVDCVTTELLLSRFALLCSYWLAFNPFIIALLLRMACFAQALQQDWRRDIAVTIVVSVAWVGLYACFAWLQMSVYALAPSIVVGALVNCAFLVPVTALLLRLPSCCRRRNGIQGEPHHACGTPPKDLQNDAASDVSTDISTLSSTTV